ncbi:MAG: A/G-specific adenine glycosylase [Candidatus Eremiobacteraeota bacterium]|nr:A/G-specific adenine glycosylase [Candidatus Eremiobacteraeota bacterium]
MLAWYARYGRTHLPWRRTRDPYRILVSESMLQQTQVERVIPLYEAFVARFPTFEALAAVDAGDVVRAWRGLGYNSRAVRLHALARAVVARHGGTLPRESEALRALPGIGAYTASAVRAFAFELDDAAVDVNLRRVIHRVVYGLEHPPLADARTLDTLAIAAVPRGAAHDWNSAMMDLGATLCTARATKCLVCPLREACAAAPVDAAQLAARVRAHAPKRAPQNAIPFERTTRFLRGRIIDRLRDVPPRESLALDALTRDLASIVPPDRLQEIPQTINALVRDGVVVQDNATVRLA